MQHVNATTRKQSGVDLERRIFRRGANEPDIPFFHVRKERVLLRLVEAMNLVDEDDGPRAVLLRPFGVGHDLLDLFNPGQHRGELNELRLGHLRDDLRESSFSGAWRSPENQRSGIISFDLYSQRLARTDQMFLPCVLIECPRTHAVRQRPRCVGGAASIRHGLKQAHET